MFAEIFPCHARRSLHPSVLAGGIVCLIDTSLTERRVHAWSHAKAVWCVRISRCEGYLAAAGYEGKLSLYALPSYALIQEITYTSSIGPPFVWSLNFSESGQRFVVGCWSGKTYVYDVLPSAGYGVERDANGIIKQDLHKEQPPLCEVAELIHFDRVYSVGLDREGIHLVVGGRDGRCTMYGRAPCSECPLQSMHHRPDADHRALRVWQVPLRL